MSPPRDPKGFRRRRAGRGGGERAAFNETRARIVTDPGAAIQLHLENAQARVDDVRALKEQRGLNEAPIFLMVGATENLMVAVENNPRAANRATLERAHRLAQDKRALLRELMQTAPVERARRNAETLFQLSASWTPLVYKKNRVSPQGETRLFIQTFLLGSTPLNRGVGLTT